MVPASLASASHADCGATQGKVEKMATTAVARMNTRNKLKKLVAAIVYPQTCLHPPEVLRGAK